MHSKMTAYIEPNKKVKPAEMSIEANEQLPGKSELYNQVREGMDDIQSGQVRLFTEALSDIRNRK